MAKNQKRNETYRDIQLAQLDELRGIRIELSAIRKHAGAPLEGISDRERFTHKPKPAGAKHGHWEVAEGQLLPNWVETPMPLYVNGQQMKTAPLADISNLIKTGATATEIGLKVLSEAASSAASPKGFPQTDSDG